MTNTIMAYRTSIHALYYCPISTGKVEGINNKMKIVAYGFRGEERYFHLRLYALHDCCFTPQVKMNLKNDPLLCHLIKE